MAEGGERVDILSKTVTDGSDICFEFFCDPCDEEGRHVDSVGFCKDCLDYLCDECFKTHHRARPSRHHVLLDRQNMPKDRNVSRRSVSKDRCTVNCQKHQDMFIDHYCHGHDALACSACAFSYHRNCKKVDCITDVADGNENKTDICGVVGRLNDLEKKAYQINQNSQDRIIVSNENSKAVITSIQTHADEVYSLLQARRNDLETEVKRLQSDNIIGLEAAKSNSDAAMQEVRDNLHGITAFQEKGQLCNLYVAIKKAQRNIPLLEQNLERTERDSRFDKLQFEPEVQLQNILHQQGALGQITTNRSTSDDIVDALFTPGDQDSELKNVENAKELFDSQCYESKRVQPSFQSPTIPQRTYVARDKHQTANTPHVFDITVKCEDDVAVCFISGLTALSNDKLVVTDYNNTNVKVIDTRKRYLLWSLTLSSGPWDVTSLEDNTLAVTLPNARKIQYLNMSTDGSLRTNRQITVKGRCRGIAYSRDMLWVSYSKPPKFEAITVDGEVQLCVTQHISQAPLHLAVSVDNKTIYVTDWDARELIRLSHTGDVLSVSKIEDVPHPTGIVVATDSTVYVCDIETGVFKLTTRCEKIGQLLNRKQVEGNSRGLACCETSNQLFVGTDRDKIIVCQLQKFF